MTAYYNEIDPYAAQWLRNLIKAGHIAPGEVDERSIVDVSADNLRGYTQCHFFAGIGGWSYALRLAGWPDDRPVWTGSCPCQPFSAAGQGKAGSDERHLWPAWFSLIAELRPRNIFGEQVEAAIRWGWLDLVCLDLEGQGYAVGAAVLPACGVGAPHIRQRLWFVANALQPASERRAGSVLGTEAPFDSARQLDGRVADGPANGGETGDMANPTIDGCRQERADGSRRSEGARAEGERRGPAEHSNGSLVNSAGEQVGLPGRTRQPRSADGELGDATSVGRPRLGDQSAHSLTRQASPWASLDWLPCTDGKARPVEPGTFPLAHGIPGRVGRLRAYGNAIVPQVAAEFIAACQEVIDV